MLAFLALLLVAVPNPPSALIIRGGAGGGPTPPPGPCTTGTPGQNAACWTAQNNALCSSATIGDFYTEIDDATSTKWTYQSGSSMNAQTLVGLDSASKIVLGAYYVQQAGGVLNLTANDAAFFHQQSGYTNLPSNCTQNGTVLACLGQNPGASAITAIGTITPGSAYTNGTFASTSLTGGSGTTAKATIVVSGGAVVSVALTSGGKGYAVGDTLSAALAGGSGFSIPVTDTTCNPSTGQTLHGLVIGANAQGALCTKNVGLFHYNGGNFQAGAAIDGPSALYGIGRGPLVSLVNLALGASNFSATFTASSAVISGTNNFAAGDTVAFAATPPAPFTVNVRYYVIAAGLSGSAFEVAATVGGTTPVVATAAATVTAMPNPFTYSMPLLAGGAVNSGKGVMAMLRHIINPTAPLLMNAALGSYEVAVNFPGNTGGPPGENYGNYIGQVIQGTTFGSPTTPLTITSSTTLNAIGVGGPNGPWIQNGIGRANFTPIPENQYYSIGHWVECDPAANGDCAFSSPGSRGVYPWVNNSKNLVGVLVRVGNPGSGYPSEQCGRLLRKAYMSGVNQPGIVPTP